MTKVIKKTVVTILLLCTALTFACFAACGVKFKVNFIVDGTVYSAIDTSGAEVIEMPQNPTKDGYTFDGWYWDKDTWQKPFTANSLLEAPLSSDMNVYCKWKANVINVESVSLSEKEISLHVGEEKTLTANVLPSDATDTSVMWESSDSAVATVVDGKITALSVGSATITVTTTDGEKVSTCSVEVVEDKITFKTLAVDGDNVYGVVSNSTTRFSFLNEIEEQGDAEYAVYREITCEIEVASKTIALNVGDNTVYVLQSVGKALKQYAVTIRRRPMYTVTFNTNGGTEVESQTIEESFCATEPTTERTGYTFDKWNYDYSNPIMKDTLISAEWVAIPYNISYKLNGGTNSNQNPSTYTIEQKITLSEPTRLGYTFIGWSNSGVIEKGNTGEKTFTASWVVSVFRSGSVITGCRSDVKNLVILKEYNGEKVTSIGREAFKNNTSIVSVTIGNGVTSIGFGAFSGCSSLTSIIIPDSVTSIGSSAFWSCSSLASVTIGNGVTSIGYGAFAECSSLKSITIPNSVTSIGESAFKNCSSLKNVTIPNSVTSIGRYAFYNCSLLTSVTIGNSVTSLGEYAFSSCSKLTSVTIPNSVTSIGDGAFDYCSSIENIYYNGDINDWVQSVCTSLMNYGKFPKRLYINGELLTEANITTATKINPYAFDGCSSLKSITIPNSVTSIGSYAFYECSSLTSVTFSDTSTWYITNSFSNWDNKSGGTETSVTRSSTNATYFKSTYYNYYWYKK